MIIKAEKKDIKVLALMLANMYKELFQADATNDFKVYLEVIDGHLASNIDHVYMDDKGRGFFIVREETEPMTPSLRRYNGIRVYISEEYRKTRLLAEFYAKLFEDFPDGDIIGVTETNSEHITVLDKRHTRIANMYKLNREKL